MIPQSPFSPSGPAPPPISPDGALSFTNLDPLAAKQMAALQATSIAKAGNRYAPGGVTSASYFGGLSNHQLSRPDASSTTDLATFSSSLQHPAQAQAANTSTMNPAAAQITHLQRKKQFLVGLANVMHSRAPLPPQLTGVPYPAGYDPSNSPWRGLDISNTDVGVIRIAGKDVDLYKLWAMTAQAGGSAKLSQQNMWGQLLAPLDLPEQFLQSNGQPQSTAGVLQHYFVQLLGPFEEFYRKNPRGPQARPQQGLPMQGAGQMRPGGMGGMPGTFPPSMANNIQVPDLSQNPMNVPFTGQPQLPTRHSAQQLPNGMGNTMDGAPFNMRPPNANGISATSSLSDMGGSVDMDPEARKRKVEDGEEANGKRARQKTGEPSDSRNGTQAPVPARTIRQPSRRKIEYVPLAREVDSAGGFNLDQIQEEYARAAQNPIKELGDWGTVDIEALTMSLRSRLSTELSYALTTVTILSLMQWKGGIQIAQVPDLFEELVDLIEDVAFDGSEPEGPKNPPHAPIVTYRHIVNGLLEEGNNPFAGLKPRKGEKEEKYGPGQRPGDIILMVTNIIRNLSVFPHNYEPLAKHERVMSTLLRLCALKETAGEPEPLSPVLSMNDVLRIRKDVVNIVVSIGDSIRLSSWKVRETRRLYEVLASYLVDPSESVPPFAALTLAGLPTSAHTMPKPPPLTDAALEAFTTVTQPDDNRHALFLAIPEAWLWTLFSALVHRLPLEPPDFSLLARPEWLAHVERLALALYALAFTAPPSLKARMGADRQLAFPRVVLRAARKLTALGEGAPRAHVAHCVRRLVEALRLVDEAGDSFDVGPKTMPALAFGMGYGEHGETRVEKGMGLLSGYQEEVIWGVGMGREVDEPMFSELASLVRVQPDAY